MAKIKCPFCAEEIQAEAVYCQFCRCDLERNKKNKKKLTTLLTGFESKEIDEIAYEDSNCRNNLHSRLGHSKNSGKGMQLPHPAPLSPAININYKRFAELSEEFDEFIISLYTLYLDSLVGFNRLHQCLLDHQNQMKSALGDCEETSNEFQDTCFTFYKSLCGEDFSEEFMLPLMKQGEVKKRTARDGTNYILMGCLCVVQAYTYWETYLRKEIAIALGVLNPKKHTKKKEIEAILKKYVSNDFWGDMRFLRHVIIHNSDETRADLNKTKLLKWFKPDDPINLDFDKMAFIFKEMVHYRTAIFMLSLPPHYAKFP